MQQQNERDTTCTTHRLTSGAPANGRNAICAAAAMPTVFMTKSEGCCGVTSCMREGRCRLSIALYNLNRRLRLVRLRNQRRTGRTRFMGLSMKPLVRPSEYKPCTSKTHLRRADHDCVACLPRRTGGCSSREWPSAQYVRVQHRSLHCWRTQCARNHNDNVRFKMRIKASCRRWRSNEIWCRGCSWLLLPLRGSCLHLVHTHRRVYMKSITNHLECSNAGFHAVHPQFGRHGAEDPVMSSSAPRLASCTSWSGMHLLC